MVASVGGTIAPDDVLTVTAEALAQKSTSAMPAVRSTSPGLNDSIAVVPTCL